MEQSFVFGILAATASLALLQAGLTWRVHRAAARLARVDDRLAHLGDAMGLLTETSEMGFRSLANELERRAVPEPAPAAAKSSKRSTERVAAASRRGRSVTDIAAAEKMSEGEVRLRLQLAARDAGVAADAPIKPKKAPARKRPARKALTVKEAERR